MDTTTFRKTLLRSAVYAMACDGEVHEDEVGAIKEMTAEAAYFADLDAEPEVRAVLDEIESRGKAAIEKLFDELAHTSFSSKQEVLVYEVLLRVMHADGKIHPDEKHFLQRIRKALETERRTLIVNFPAHLEYLLSDQSTASQGFSENAEVLDVSFSDNLDDDLSSSQ